MGDLSKRKYEIATGIILLLDEYARGVDRYEFGLPCYDEHLVAMKELVSEKLLTFEMKTCLLINAPNSWILDVDGKRISFYGSKNAEYFADMYGKAGYKVIWEEVKS